MQNPAHDRQSSKSTKAGRVHEEGTRETIRVRQGITGQGLRYVLAFGLAGVVLAFAAIAFLLPQG